MKGEGWKSKMKENYKEKRRKGWFEYTDMHGYCFSVSMDKKSINWKN